jgi:hypothetical protein
MSVRLEGTRVFVTMAVAAIAAVASGCCGGGPDHTCTAAMEYGGGKYASRGGGDSKETAKKQAEAGVCLAYCQQGDPVVEDAWKKWKTTPEGQRAKTGKSFDVGFQKPLKVLYERCTARCNADIAAKKTTVTTTCES